MTGGTDKSNEDVIETPNFKIAHVLGTHHIKREKSHLMNSQRLSTQELCST